MGDRITAIIPARGGSIGIARKNLQEINGIPLIAWAIRKAQQVADAVIVSSDDSEILDVAASEGVIRRQRPEFLARSETCSLEVLCDTQRFYSLSGTIMFVQCTAPLMTVGDLQACVDGLPGYDLSVVCHPWHGFLLDSNGRCVNVPTLGDQPVPRRQELEPTYQIAGSAWCCDWTYLDREWYSGRVNPVVRPGFHLEIDTPGDLELARRWMATYPSVATADCGS